MDATAAPRACPPEVIALVERFERDRERLFGSAYKEENVKQEFLEPFFRALGWDVSNIKEVVKEYSLSIKRSAKSVDYGFLVQGKLKFFVEAKKPAVDLAADPKPALQLRTYGWNGGLAFSILTDFEGLAVYDTSIRPKQGDAPVRACLRRFHFKEYITKWDTIWNLFSSEAVRAGALEAYAAQTKSKKETMRVDESFLEDIEEWRIQLAKNLVANNPLSVEDLSGAVQALIDRIVFLRICEDRGLELEGRLARLLESNGVYNQLKELFRLADGKYNSGLFHFEDVKGRPGQPDTLANRLVVEDKVLKEVIKGLYDPNKPYDFSIMPPEILGQVYEQFLGKVIRITESGERAKVEDKPEVKKAGGVYYTPTYIVDHIVKNTVGRLLEGKTPKEAAELKIVDPACGSGSFLIGAYQFLLDWHRDWYVADGVKKSVSWRSASTF